MVVSTPIGYHDSFDPKDARILIRPGKGIQAAELNAMQTGWEYQLEQAMKKFLSEGSWLNGGGITTTPAVSGLTVTVNEGQVWGLSRAHSVDSMSVDITGVGREVVGLKIINKVITPQDDPRLLSPAGGSSNYGKEGAHRLQFEYSYVVNDSTAIPIATFIDGILVVPPIDSNNFLDEVYKVLAQRTRESDGDYLSIRPNLEVKNVGDSDNPAQLILEVEAGGIGYIQGWRRTINQTEFLPLKRPMSGSQRISEPEIFYTATKVYEVDNHPYLTVDDLLATVQSAEFDLTRGQQLNGPDAIPLDYQPVESIVLVKQGATTYVQGVDYIHSGNYVQWKAGGTAPAAGSTYKVTVRFTEHLLKGVRTLTKVTAEAKTVTTGAITLEHSDIHKISLLEKSDHSVQYSENANPGYTIAKNTGVVTFTGVSNGTNVLVTYEYWAHTEEGNYVSRDSFQDAAGNILFYASPTKTPSGVAVDFTKHISFDTSANPKPVDTTTFYATYTYAEPRVDVLVWRGGTGGASGIGDGLHIIEGTAGPFPATPTINIGDMPIAKLYLPAEAFDSDVQIELYNNLVMPVVEQRKLQQAVYDLRYNQAQFQLAQDTLSIPTTTDKRGVWADPLTSLHLADINNVDFAGTLDPFERSFSLPRVQYNSKPTITVADNKAVLKDGMWFPRYTEDLVLSQPFESGAVVINKYDNINSRAFISLNPAIDTSIKQEIIDIYTEVSVTEATTKQVKHHQLLATISPNTELAQKLGKKTQRERRGKVLDKIPPPSEWETAIEPESATLDLSEASGNKQRKLNKEAQWEKILANSQAIVDVYSGGATITVSGKFFTPGERAITAEFNSTPIALTATGTTSAETDPAYPGAVIADTNGEFTATFTVPDGTPEGAHLIELWGRDLVAGRIISYGAADFISQPTVQQQELHITTALPLKIARSRKAPLHVLTHALGLGVPSEKVLKSHKGPLGYSIGNAIIQAQDQGVVLTKPTLQAAITAMFSVTALKDVVGLDAHITAIANAASLVSTDAISNGNAMITASKIAAERVSDLDNADVDPKAQTFKAPETGMLTSIRVYFGIAPESEPVGIALAPTLVGFPTTDYLGVAWNAAEDCTTSSDGIKFSFEHPVYVEEGKEYAFVVMTNDPAASLKIATIGQPDPTRNNQLIIKNPATGTLLESPNASSWSVLPSSDLKFDIFMANFTDSETILSLGTTNFAEAISMISLNLPFAEPSSETVVTQQYSLDGNTWFDLVPLKEHDLKNAHTAIQLRVKLKNSTRLCAPIVNAPSLCAFINLASGAYVSREASLNDAEADTFDVYLDVDLPGSTTVSVYLALDGASYVQMTEQVGDAQPVTDVFTRRHYTYTAGGLKQDIRLKVVLGTSATYITPRIMKPRLIAG